MKTIIPFLLLSFSIFASDKLSDNKFEDESKIHWRLTIIKNKDPNITYESHKINLVKKNDLVHKKLEVKCTSPNLKRAYIEYDPTKDTGYSRMEEIGHFTCQLGSTKIASKKIKCAASKASNGAGNIYSDSTDYQFSKAKSSYTIELACLLK